MVEYGKVNVTLPDTQLKKLKTAVKNKVGAALRMSSSVFATWIIIDNKTKKQK